MQWVRNLCRLCGEIGDLCYNIFEPNSGLEEKIKKCLSLQMFEEDFKPNEICSLCYNKVNYFLQFIDLCIATSMKFDSIYYADPYYVMPSDKNLSEASISHIQDHSDSHKQSVIVSNRKGTDVATQYQELNKDEAFAVIANCHQPDTLEFNVNYNHPQPTKLSTCFTDCKAKNEIKILSDDLIAKIGSKNKKSENYKIKQTNKKVMSVDEVKKSLKSELLNELQNSDIKKEKTYCCPHCEKIFKRRINLTAHISVHTNIRGFKCSKCPKTFAVKCHLTQHYKTHSELFKCHICQKSFEVPSKLSRHMQTHGTDKPFICNFTNCNWAFSDKHNLKQHIFCHTAVKSMSCNICGKLFKTKKNLNAHVKSHVSEIVYRCSYCEKCFRSKHNLKTHIIKHQT